MATIYNGILESTTYQSAKKQLLESLRAQLNHIRAPQNSQPALKEAYASRVDHIAKMRGREFFFKFLGSGAGNGPFIELADGSIKYDLVTSIGVNFFGHNNLELFEAEFDGLWGSIMQGNLGPNDEYGALMDELLGCVGPQSPLKQVWISTCGASANEIALKIIRQKKYPASRVITFRRAFAGRTTALQEITDNPKYREGQPTYGEVFYLEFFNPAGKASAADQAACVAAGLRNEVARYPEKYAALLFELIQGEGGFFGAPREFFLPIIEEARKLGLAIWVDEIQTFGRTGEIFRHQELGLDELVDVVTVAKILQCGAVLFRPEFNPKPGLVSGTFAASTSGLRAGIKILELLKTKICGSNGRIRSLEKITHEEFARIKSGPAGKYLVDTSVYGGMIAFTLFDGSLEKTKKFLFNLWDLGAIAFYCGHGPYRVRMLPPFGVLEDNQWREALKIVESAIEKTAKELS